MISGVAINPVTSATDFRAQPIVAAATAAAPTDLPASQAVNPTVNIPPARTDARRTIGNSAPSTSRSVTIDPQTDALVFRSLDPNSGIVLDQVPSQALLRQRAYYDAQTVQALVTGKDPANAGAAAAQDLFTTA